MRTPKLWGRLTARKQSGTNMKGPRPADPHLRRQILSAIVGGIARAVAESLLTWLSR